jgi:iron complex transport system substrate-binding protein
MRRSLVAVGLAVALALSACGSDSDASSSDTSATTATVAPSTAAPATAAPSSPAPTTPPAGFPVTVTADNGEVTVETLPERIVSLSPTATEMLFAIGAGDQVDAVDDQSTYPPEAPLSELSGFTPNVEAIAGRDPDLVVVAFDANGVVAALEALDIPVILLDAARDLDGTYAQIELLGAATGATDGAAALVAEMRDDVAEVTARVQATGLTYFHELDELLYTVTSQTFIGEVYSLLGLVNVADPADADGTGYPQLSAEFLVDADPDLIFLADTKCCGQTPGDGRRPAGMGGAHRRAHRQRGRARRRRGVPLGTTGGRLPGGHRRRRGGGHHVTAVAAHR